MRELILALVFALVGKSELYGYHRATMATVLHRHLLRAFQGHSQHNLLKLFSDF